MRDIKTIIVSAFPGTGKSFFTKENNQLVCCDSDSSEFSWVKDGNGDNTNDRRHDFPKNYIDHIKSNIGRADIIFVSSHKVVRDALIAEGIEFMLVYPGIEQKDEYIRRYTERGNNEKFIEFISNNWDNFIKEIQDEKSEFVEKVELRHEESYIGEAIQWNLRLLSRYIY